MNTLEQLIADINSNRYMEMTVYAHMGVGLITRDATFEQMKVQKDEEGTIPLGIDLDVYYIGDHHEIIKSTDATNSDGINYEIREDELLLLVLNLHN